MAPNIALQTYIDAAKRYDERRIVARERTQVTMYDMALAGEAPMACTSLDIMEITEHALIASSGWKLRWRLIENQFRSNLRRLDLAFWYQGGLYGLAIGRVSRGKNNVTLHYLERAWEDNPFSGWIAKMSTDAADNFAKVLNAPVVRIKNPVSQVIEKYESLRFSLAGTFRGATYYERRVEP